MPECDMAVVATGVSSMATVFGRDDYAQAHVTAIAGVGTGELRFVCFHPHTSCLNRSIRNRTINPNLLSIIPQNAENISVLRSSSMFGTVGLGPVMYPVKKPANTVGAD